MLSRASDFSEVLRVGPWSVKLSVDDSAGLLSKECVWHTGESRDGCYDGIMHLRLDPFRLLLISLAGWPNQRQQDALDYLQEENCVLREQLGGKRLLFNDEPRRPWAVRAKKLGWTTILPPATLLARQRG
jgi:hypothetical protein